MEEKSQKNPGLVRMDAKELEELLISRFERNFQEYRPFGQIFHPLDNGYYHASSSNKEAYRSNSYRQVIEIMKKNKVFNRAVLEEMPYQEVSRFEIYRKSFFGKATPRIIVAAVCLSPLEALVKGEEPSPLGIRHLEEAVHKIVREKDLYYYLGIGSTSGWEEKVWGQEYKGINWIAGVLSPVEGTYWKKRFPHPEHWYGLDPVFDPEMDSEKLERAKKTICSHPKLRLKGSHILVDQLFEEVDVPDYIFIQALDQLIQEEPSLEVKDIAGKKIIQRKRI